MTITQADREAAAKACEPLYSPAHCTAMREGMRDKQRMVQAFAAHREAERRAIAEWLRAMAEPLPINGDKRHIIQHLADALERGEDRT